MGGRWNSLTEAVLAVFWANVGKILKNSSDNEHF